jgi:hypothetical protein
MGRILVATLVLIAGCAAPDRPRQPPVINPVSSEAERQRACDQYWAYTLTFPDLSSGACSR